MAREVAAVQIYDVGFCFCLSWCLHSRLQSERSSSGVQSVYVEKGFYSGMLNPTWSFSQVSPNTRLRNCLLTCEGSDLQPVMWHTLMYLFLSSCFWHTTSPPVFLLPHKQTETNFYLYVFDATSDFNLFAANGRYFFFLWTTFKKNKTKEGSSVFMHFDILQPELTWMDVF